MELVNLAVQIPEKQRFCTNRQGMEQSIQIRILERITLHAN